MQNEDDSDMYCSSLSLSETFIIVNREIKLGTEWLRRNRMTVDIQIFNYIVFSTCRRQVENALSLQPNDELNKVSVY